MPVARLTKSPTIVVDQAIRSSLRRLQIRVEFAAVEQNAPSPEMLFFEWTRGYLPTQYRITTAVVRKLLIRRA
jgi:hypothetical protein